MFECIVCFIVIVAISCVICRQELWTKYIGKEKTYEELRKSIDDRYKKEMEKKFKKWQVK